MLAAFGNDNLLFGETALINYQITHFYHSDWLAHFFLWISFDNFPPFFVPSWNCHFCPITSGWTLSVKIRYFSWQYPYLTSATSNHLPVWWRSILMCSRRLCLSADSPALCLPHFTVNPGINCTNHHRTIFSIKTWMTFVLLMAPKNLFELLSDLEPYSENLSLQPWAAFHR